MGWVEDNIVDPVVGQFFGGDQKEAAQAQEQLGRESIAFQRESRDLAREDLQPFRQAGVDILGELGGVAGNIGGVDNQLFQILNERALPAISESRAAGGLFDSAGTRDMLTDRLFENFLIAGPQLQGQRFNQLFNLANLGQSSAAGQANTAMNAGANIGNTLEGIGNARAGGIIGANMARGNTINELFSFGGNQSGQGGGSGNLLSQGMKLLSMGGG